MAKVLETLAENRYQDSPPAKLVAVTKTVTPRVINLLKPMEIWDIGENRAQVALPKLPEISPEFHLHWIGRLQTNKVKYIIDHVCLLHALDRMDLARRSTAAPAAGTGAAGAGSGQHCAGAPEGRYACGGSSPVSSENAGFFRSACRRADEHHAPVRRRGRTARLFRGMRRLFDQLRDEALPNVEMRELSMGMSRDYRIAAQEGATMVRVGTALYQD